MINFDESRKFHPMRECIGKTIAGTGNSANNISLTFEDDTVLIFDLSGDELKVSLEERKERNGRTSEV